MTTYYNNKRFTLSAEVNDGIISMQIDTGYYSTGAIVYENNTIGYDNLGLLSSKEIRRAVNSVVTRLTGKPALVNINVMNELKTYTEYYSL